MKRSISSMAVIWSACALAACSGTDTGNPFDAPGGGLDSDAEEGAAASGRCDEGVADIELDAPSALGFSASQVLEFAGGEHTVSLAWLEDPIASYGPESGRSAITLTIEPLAAQFVDRSFKTSSEDVGFPTVDSDDPRDSCRDSIRLDVRVGVSTAGGALAETVETTLDAFAPDFVSGFLSFDVNELMGSFEAEPALPRSNTELTRSSLQLSFGLSQHGAVGSLVLFNVFRNLGGNTEGAIAGGGSIAHFPADDYCGATSSFSVSAEQALRGVSMATTLAALNARSPVPVEYRDDESSTLELSFTSDVERVCVSFDAIQSSAVLEFPGRVTLESADGRIDGAFDVTLLAEPLGGGLIFQALGEGRTQDALEAAALSAAFGVRDEIDFTPYDGALVLFSSSSSSVSSGGGLSVLSGAIDRELLWQATWGETAD
ncbi:MAG: hypothetical protein ABW217_13585 [Polyangiaceae bacterium]